MSNEPSKYSVERYGPGRKDAWDAFLREAKNATFLFQRDYMDYHSDRFADHSLMVFRGQELAAVLPANITADRTLVSHQGLTYGGFAVSRRATLEDVLECFQAGLAFLHQQGISTVLYKRCPRFYNSIPDDEVDYALFLLDAELSRRDCALVVNLAERLPLQKRRQRVINKARQAGLRISQDTSFAPFWDGVLAPRLASRFGVKPVHTVEEITLLGTRFPGHIKQFSVYSGGDILAGTTIYETHDVAHAQYIAATDRGLEIGAVDLLFAWFLDEAYKGKRLFSFGICNENEGRNVNHGLLEWKEGFGGRTCAHDFYRIATGNHSKLSANLSRRLGAGGPIPSQPVTPDKTS